MLWNLCEKFVSFITYIIMDIHSQSWSLSHVCQKKNYHLIFCVLFVSVRRMQHHSREMIISLFNSITNLYLQFTYYRCPPTRDTVKPLISWPARCLAPVLGHTFHSDQSQQSSISSGRRHNVCRLQSVTFNGWMDG